MLDNWEGGWGSGSSSGVMLDSWEGVVLDTWGEAGIVGLHVGRLGGGLG